MADGEGVISTVLFGPDQRTRITPGTTDVLFAAYAPTGVTEEGCAITSLTYVRPSWWSPKTHRRRPRSPWRHRDFTLAPHTPSDGGRSSPRCRCPNHSPEPAVTGQGIAVVGLASVRTTDAILHQLRWGLAGSR